MTLFVLLLFAITPTTSDTSVFVPPGTDNSGPEELFGDNWEFRATARLKDLRTDTINTVNDWHYAMLNDAERNEAFYRVLASVITPESRVIDIGAGSGLLSLMAAQLGAKSVLAVEGNRDLAVLADRVIRQNGYAERIKVVHALSTDVELPEEGHVSKGNVLVSEIIGTLLLGESQLHYVTDARNRLLTEGAVVIPASGVQYVTLIQSFALDNLTRVQTWRDFDLSAMNELMDTDSMLKTKQIGIRLADLDFQEMIAKPVPLLEVDFAKSTMESAYPDTSKPRRFRLTAKRSGVVHAVVAYFDLCIDASCENVVSTNPRRTTRNRDMAWGQNLQTVEDWRLAGPQGEDKAARDEAVFGSAKTKVNARHPNPIVVEAGDELELEAHYGEGGMGMQFRVSTVTAADSQTSAVNRGYQVAREQARAAAAGEGKPSSGTVTVRDLEGASSRRKQRASDF